MESRKSAGRRRHNNNNLLLVILIGFCILALIEILYGQAQMKVEKERLALAEENNQTVQELKNEWNQIKEGTSVVTQEGEPEQSVGGKEESEEQTKVVEQSGKPADTDDQAKKEDDQKEEDEDDGDYNMQIVILGDSIMDHDRTESGPAAIIAQACGAKVYNMSMGGTTAALLPGESAEREKWESRCLLGVVQAIQGNISYDIFDGFPAKDVLENCDFDKTDYFILEYGVNDFLSRQIPQSKYLEDGGTLNVGLSYTYTGALEDAVTSLQASFPDAKILIVAPHYCQIFSGKTFMGDAYSVDYGYGPLISFARGAGYIYEQHKDENVLFYNAFELSGINAETADDYLEDGVHMTPLGSRVYAEAIARVITKDFYPEE